MVRTIALTFSIAVTIAALDAHAAGMVTSLDDIEFWVGTGSNRSAIAIDWDSETSDDEALVWGYRWDESATGEEMLLAVLAADERLFAKLNDTSGNDTRLYGLGYDLNDNGQFAIDDGTIFSDDGIAYGDESANVSPGDPEDVYQEGWHSAQFWHYAVAEGESFPATDEWSSSQRGMSTRMLMDGSWDSWAIAPLADFLEVFATNPHAAEPPGLAGDFNHDGVVNSADYVVWRNADRSDAEYTIWKANYGRAQANANGVPEPGAATLFTFALFVLTIAAGGSRDEHQSHRGCRPRLKS
jgi:hypothetical protein